MSKALWQRPEYRAKQAAGLAVVGRARLPEMSDREYRQYRYLTNYCGLDRGSALAEIFRSEPERVVVAVVCRGCGRLYEPDEAVLRVGPLELDVARHELRVDGERVHLTAQEMNVLEALMRNPGVAVSHDRLHGAITSADPPGPQAAGVFLSRIRKKLGRHRAMIRNVWGVGFVIGAPETPE